jgi:hypothetical protein
MKKILTPAIVLLLVISLLTACGGGSSNAPSGGNSASTTPPASTNSGGNSTGTPSMPSSGKVEYDQVILDAEGMKVTLTGFGYGAVMGDHAYYFTIENKTNREINTRFSSKVSVNGCMIDSLAVNSDRTTRTNAGETTDKAYVRFSPSYLEDRGIGENWDFECIIELIDGNNDIFFVSEPVTLPGPNGSGAKQTFSADGVVILEGAGVKVTAIQLDYDIFFGLNHGIWVLIENNSGKDIRVVETGAWQISCEVASGKAAFDYITCGTDKDKIEEVSLDLSVNEWLLGEVFGSDTLHWGEEVTVKFDASGKIIK